MFISCFICQIVFFYRIKKYNITGYNCSDSITNELIRKGTADNEKQILYITIKHELIVFNPFLLLVFYQHIKRISAKREI